MDKILANKQFQFTQFQEVQWQEPKCVSPVHPLETGPDKLTAKNAFKILKVTNSSCLWEIKSV